MTLLRFPLPALLLAGSAALAACRSNGSSGRAAAHSESSPTHAARLRIAIGTQDTTINCAT
ncbi:MAG TPA: hypothetical protein VG963_04565, partial [Polyangiaceae bacterium]|nr:hypothetical protein [Polyangiaceae bacterium]